MFQTATCSYVASVLKDSVMLEWNWWRNNHEMVSVFLYLAIVGVEIRIDIVGNLGLWLVRGAVILEHDTGWESIWNLKRELNRVVTWIQLLTEREATPSEGNNCSLALFLYSF